MKRVLAVLSLAVSILAPLAAQGDDTANAPRIPIAEFRQLMVSGKVLVVDVRDAQSYVTGHIPGAQSAPLDTLLAPKTLDVLKTAGSRPIVLYCA
jgi:rhodanese-related sulfurtransferase